jgi:hypothetical protein
VRLNWPPQQQVEEVDALMFLTANGAPPDL